MINTHPNNNTIASLSNADWAWEFLRRNPDYQRDHRLSRIYHLNFITHPSGVEFLRIRRQCPFAAKWGLLHMPDPNLSSNNAHIAWHADVVGWAVEADASAASSSDENIDFDVGTVRFDRIFLIIGPAFQNLYLRIGSHPSCLKVSSDSVLFHPVRMRFFIDGFDQVRSALAALEVVRSVKKRVKLPKIQVPYVTQLRRLKYLIAAEKAIEGSFLRDIGAAIYGGYREYLG